MVTLLLMKAILPVMVWIFCVYVTSTDEERINWRTSVFSPSTLSRSKKHGVLKKVPSNQR